MAFSKSVLHIITGLGRGGAEHMLYKLLSAMDGNLANHHVLSLGRGGPYAEKIRGLGIPVHELGMRMGRPNPMHLLRLRGLVRKLNPDLVHGWMYHGILAARLAAQGRPVVAGVRHSIYKLSDEKFTTRLVIRAVASLSPSLAALTYNAHLSLDQHRDIGFSSKKACVIPNGFDPDRLRPDPKGGTRLRAELGIRSDAFVVLHAARFHPMKDHESLLQAIARIKDQKMVFLLAGTQVDAGNPALSGLQDDRVYLLGERDDIVDLMTAADCLVNSSWSEAFPNVLGEAMACGLPAIATDVGESAAILGETGLVVPPRDPEALAKVLVLMKDMPQEQRIDMGKRARQRVIETFSLSKVASDYLALYQDILDAGSQR
ncbi:glycosyl transferase [Iodidimonas gelatinilytica]|uniref:Glycosyl transferase n=1 Tax=Iodidimonas gelatinilytica TaxID=1236966 RepID=A0A5A7MVB9_9PROT|nr:glycosyltransferase [Iodidimonas gelatinilytica]GEQ99776.1 glycosyl transferase [Iodidimonas gelatinilytica]